METKDYLSFLVHEVHTTVVAAADDDGKPVTCAVNRMDCDESSLYFLTIKGKRFYEASASVRGKVRELGIGKVKELF